VVLLDEIEKAHPDVFNLLLQVMDEGRLTDSTGRTVSFRNTILIMTSNVGSRELDEYGSGVGFSTSMKNVKGNRKNVLEKAVKKAFPPEFINRVDEQIFFNPLTKEDIGKIIDIELKGLKNRVKEAGFELTITPAAKRFVADAGFDPSYGARPLERAIRKYIEDPVSEYIISDKIFGKTGSGESHKLRVGLSADKESTTVEWK
jgi:ATP-dependent Clp protease ATP-binding subunit ClpC